MMRQVLNQKLFKDLVDGPLAPVGGNVPHGLAWGLRVGQDGGECLAALGGQHTLFDPPEPLASQRERQKLLLFAQKFSDLLPQRCREFRAPRHACPPCLELRFLHIKLARPLLQLRRVMRLSAPLRHASLLLLLLLRLVVLGGGVLTCHRLIGGQDEIELVQIVSAAFWAVVDAHLHLSWMQMIFDLALPVLEDREGADDEGGVLVGEGRSGLLLFDDGDEGQHAQCLPQAHLICKNAAAHRLGLLLLRRARDLVEPDLVALFDPLLEELGQPALVRVPLPSHHPSDRVLLVLVERRLDAAAFLGRQICEPRFLLLFLLHVVEELVEVPFRQLFHHRAPPRQVRVWAVTAEAGGGCASTTTTGGRKRRRKPPFRGSRGNQVDPVPLEVVVEHVELLLRREKLDRASEIIRVGGRPWNAGLEPDSVRAGVVQEWSQGRRRLPLDVPDLRPRQILHPDGVPVVAIVRLSDEIHKLTAVYDAGVVLDADDPDGNLPQLDLAGRLCRLHVDGHGGEHSLLQRGPLLLPLLLPLAPRCRQVRRESSPQVHEKVLLVAAQDLDDLLALALDAAAAGLPRAAWLPPRGGFRW
mmetsp:Transcript_11505/g.24395  ORF Transcript_11505/g.24395 Transcript_11505/m.24395 type:complete len:585 (-) Transcript_11505:306-2060(-)